MKKHQNQLIPIDVMAKKNFLTLDLWGFIAFECNYLENQRPCQHETHIFLLSSPQTVDR
jgi:hypothetical protein